MVTTIKTLEEWKELWQSENVGIGVFFNNAQLTKAKGDGFKKLRVLIKQIEDNGTDVYYKCSEECINFYTGKKLYFVIKGNNISTSKIKDSIAAILDELKNTGKIKEDDILCCKKRHMIVPGGYGGGVPACCPLF